MIRKIQTSELKIGMYIHDLGRNWVDHPFIISSFFVKDRKHIRKIVSASIGNVYIDTDKGMDVEDHATSQDFDGALQDKAESIVEKTDSTRVSVASEWDRAKSLRLEATSAIRNLMEDARLGKLVEVASLHPLAERIVQSAFRNHHALAGVSRIKTKDQYTFMHSVSVAGLLVAFAKTQGFSEEELHQVAIGGMLHDIGKIMVPAEVLNKPGSLEPEEFEIMKDHVSHSRDIFAAGTTGITQTATDISLLHHERIDGSGYPLGLSGELISVIGRMSAIVDVYDALTSVRVYKSAWEPSVALKKLSEWTPDHFDGHLVQRFVKCLGIYPVGSLVQLESGLVGIVMDLGEDMLRPILRVIYNAKKERYEKVRDLDLAKARTDRVVKAVSPAKFKVNIADFL